MARGRRKKQLEREETSNQKEKETNSQKVEKNERK